MTTHSQTEVDLCDGPIDFRLIWAILTVGLCPRPPIVYRRLSRDAHADVAQLVEHHLAKVRVAGSNPVVRSEKVSVSQEIVSLPVEWPRGEATDCKSVYTGSNPVSTSLPW